jgi:uncharacterized protein (TIGR03437 family)
VFVAAQPSPTYAPTQHIAGVKDGPSILTRLSVNGKGQPVSLACIGNAASNVPGSVANVEIVTLFGERLGPAQAAQPQVDMNTGFPTSLANVQVTFDGTPAPLLSVQESQIQAIAPWSLQAGQTTEVCVTYNDTRTDCLKKPVVKGAPGIFRAADGYFAALNADGSVNSASNPAKYHSIVSIFGTGFGPVNPPQRDGAIVGFPLPVNVLSAKVSLFAGVRTFPGTDPQYAGPAPFQVAGVTQLNVSAEFFSMCLGIDGLVSLFECANVHVSQ